MTRHVGKAVDRVDGRDKVTGKATYSAEWDLPNTAHAVLVTSPISRGKLASIDVSAAERAPGVVLVLTHHNAHPGGLSHFTKGAGKAFAGPIVPPDVWMALSDDVIRYSGQPIALVVAETREQARTASKLVKAKYDVEKPEVELAAKLGEQFPPDQIFGQPPDHARGDFARGLAEARAKVDVTYSKLAESHNPMEPHATTAVYKNGKLTIYDATQYVGGVKLIVAFLLGLSPANVRAVCRYVGGGFGSKGLPWPHVPLTALASLRLERPVKLVLERRQMFGLIGYRPHTIQRVRLGAKSDGTLTAIAHDGISNTSRFGQFTEPVGKMTQIMYACPNVSVTHRLVRLDTQTPTFQRAPGEAPGSIALECALDELAHELAIDPLALRLKNYAESDPEYDRPWSSKALRECYRKGAERFGWGKRPLLPGQLKQGNKLLGWGMATATYPTNRSAGAARVRIEADGSALVQIAAHDLGTGAYTVLTQVAADALGLPMARVRTEIGDSDLPEGSFAGGSQTTATCSTPVHEAASALRQELAKLALGQPDSPLYGLREEDLGWGDGKLYLRADPSRSDDFASILGRARRNSVETLRESVPGDEKKKYGSHAWGAQFAEVLVDPELGTVRVTRMVGAFAGGRIINLKTARSQLIGGMVMGIGMALLEEVVRDPRQGRVVNGNLEGYMLPVHADVPAIEALFVAEADPYVNPLGVKGIGELGIVGAGAAIANAVFHATGKRIRDLPIRIEQLL